MDGLPLPLIHLCPQQYLESFLSAKLLLFDIIIMSITRTKSESFLLLCQDLETHLLVLGTFLTQANAILDLSKNSENQNHCLLGEAGLAK